MTRILFTLTLLVLSISSAAAQDTDGWPVEQRCVGEPTAPPEGWTFEGTILMTGYAGIHAVQADWETPQVVVFLGERDVWGGALSPDGLYYASPYGVTYTTETYNTITEVEEIRVYSTQDNREEYRIPIPWTFFPQETHAQLYWQNSEVLIYEDWMSGEIRIDPFSGETAEWDGPSPSLSGYDGRRPYPSPDWTRTIFAEPYLGNTGEWRWGSYNVARNELLTSLPLRTIPAIAWSPASTYFVAETGKEGKDSVGQFSIFDREGGFSEALFTVPAGQRIGVENIAWSANGRYLAFITHEDTGYYTLENDIYESYRGYLTPNILYIVDTHHHYVRDTCLDIGRGLAWSPDNTQLAFFQPGREQTRVMVFDLETWTLHPVAIHIADRWSDYVIGWRE